MTGAGTELETTHGRTTIADSVVVTVAGLAARDVAGVHDLDGGRARVVGAVTSRIPGGRTASGHGVTVEVGRRQAAIDLTVVVDYGAPIAHLARAVRANVIAFVERMTGLAVVEVNINIADLHQTDTAANDSPARGGNRQSSVPARRAQ